MLVLFITLSMIISSCYYPREEEIFSVSYVENTATKSVLEPTNTSNLQEKVEIGEIKPTPTLEEPEKIEKPTPTKEVELNLEGFYKEVSFESEALLNWYKEFFKPVQIKECTGCSSDEILELLEPYEEWIIVQNGQILIIHSGWPLGKDPAFGQMFVLILREGGDLTGVIFCLDDICFEILDWVILARDEVGGSIPVNQIFDEVSNDDYYLITCSDSMIPGLKTPKLVLRMQVINP